MVKELKTKENTDPPSGTAARRGELREALLAAVERTVVAEGYQALRAADLAREVGFAVAPASTRFPRSAGAGSRRQGPHARHARWRTGRGGRRHQGCPVSHSAGRDAPVARARRRLSAVRDRARRALAHALRVSGGRGAGLVPRPA